MKLFIRGLIEQYVVEYVAIKAANVDIPRQAESVRPAVAGNIEISQDTQI